MSSKQQVPPPPAWVAAVQAVSRAFGVFSAGLIVLSIGVVCHMVFVRAVLGESSIWQTEFVTFSLVAATFLGSPPINLWKATGTPQGLTAAGVVFEGAFPQAAPGNPQKTGENRLNTGHRGSAAKTSKCLPFPIP